MVGTFKQKKFSLERNQLPKLNMWAYTAKQKTKSTYTYEQVWGNFPQILNFFGFTYTASQKGEATYYTDMFST